MPFAVKHFDIVLGIDVHIVQPPGTVPPTPVPHPFAGVVLDPFDYIPLLGATVYVNGLPRGQAGSAGLPIPSHIPIGGVFVNPPGNECELFMGSTSVEVEGEPFAYLGLPVLSCSDIGAPPPPRAGGGDASGGDQKPKSRPKKKPKQSKPIGLVAPTSVVLAIPMGAPVDVGGAPTISIAALAGRAAFAAIGAGARKLRKLQKQSERALQLSQKLHRRAKKWMDALGVAESSRHRVHKAICTMTGHPVDVATGKVVAEAVDWSFAGPLPLLLERTWYSTSSYRGPLGHGWHHALDLALVVGDEVVVVRLSDGRTLAAPLLEIGQRWFDRKDKLTLTREAQGWRLHTRGGHQLVFADSGARARGRLRPLTAVEDRSGNRVELRHDEAGRLRELVDSGGRSFPITCDEDGRIIEIRGPHPDADGQLTLLRYLYDRAGDLVEVHDALGQITRYRYARHLLVHERDRAGLSFYFEYDNGLGPDSPQSGPGPAATDARCLRTWGDGGIHDHRLRYDDDARTTTVTNGLGHTSVCHFTEAGLVDRVVDPLGHERVTEFDRFNDVIAETDGLGQRTRVVRDARGNPVEIVGPDGATRVIAYDEHDQPLRSIDQAGGWWQWRYDERGRLLGELRPDGSASFVIWEGRRLVATLPRGGPLSRFEYDDAGQLRARVDADGHRYERRCDHLGRLVEERAPSGVERSLRRDLLGRVVELRQADGSRTHYSYDPEGRIVHQREEQRELELEWSGMGKLARRREIDRATGAVYERRFTYDLEERLLEFRNELGHVHRFERDGRGQVVAELGFDGRRRSYARDPLGRVVEATLPSGRSRSYTWSRAGHLAKIAYDDGSLVEFSHRGDGAMLSARSNDGAPTIRIERDALGRVTREWQGVNWITSELDGLGRRVRMRSSFGAVLDLQRDQHGDWTGLRYADATHEAGERPLWQARVERDWAGNEIDRQLPGGARSRWARDPLGRPHQHQLWDGREVIRDRRYGWGPGARLDRIQDSRRGTTEYGHDARGFLTWTRREGELELRVPDAAGNLYHSRDGEDRRYGPAGELLEARVDGGIRRYEYDLDGNLIRRIEPDGGEWIYEWNAAGLLARVVPPDGDPVEFVYDAFARRVEKRVGRELTRWIWDGDVPLHEWRETIASEATEREDDEDDEDEDERTEFVLPAFVAAPERAVVGDEDGTEHVAPAFARGREDAGGFLRPQPVGLVTWLFDPGSFAPVAKIVGLVALTVVTDHLGTPVSLLGADGREAPAEECPFGFPGQYADPETGLYYNVFRYYDPETEAYISQDPLGFFGGARIYGYVFDPLTRTDPWGLRDPETCAEVFGYNVNYDKRYPHSYWVPSPRGGELWVNMTTVNITEALEPLYRPNTDLEVTVIIGHHGGLNGEVALNPENPNDIWDDLPGCRSYMKKTNPLYREQFRNIWYYDTRTVVANNQLDEISNVIKKSPGRIICAWCYSDRSTPVLNGLLGR